MLKSIVVAFIILGAIGCGSDTSSDKGFVPFPGDSEIDSGVGGAPARLPGCSDGSGARCQVSSATVGCGLNSGHPGDGMCLVAPSDGIQIHYGPVGYDDPTALAPYMLAPGGETVTYKVVADSHPDVYINSYEVSERSGMHHLAFYTGKSDVANGLDALTNPALFLAQTAHESTTMGDGAPEYTDAAVMAAAGSFVVAVHATNETPEPVLIEAWVNLHTVAAPKVLLLPLQLAGGTTMAVPPHAKQTITAGAPTPTEDIVQLVGHFHSHTTEERASLNGVPIYSTSMWLEPKVQWFTSLTTPLHAAAGAMLSWECDVDNTTDAVLRYANAVDTAEMCNLVGFRKAAN